MEELPVVLLCLGISGLYHKLIAGVLGFVYIIFRILYSVVTMKSAGKRNFTMILGFPALYGLICLAFASVFQAYFEATKWKDWWKIKNNSYFNTIVNTNLKPTIILQSITRLAASSFIKIPQKKFNHLLWDRALVKLSQCLNRKCLFQIFS